MPKRTRLSLIALFVSVIMVGVFCNQSAAMLINDISEPNNSIIEVGDVVNISVQGYEEDYNRTVIVPPDGKIRYMSLGEMQAAGITASQLADEIKTRLQIYISDPQVEITVKQKEYIIQSDDVISITVEGHEDYGETAVVQPNGKIIYAPLGEMQAADLTVFQLEAQIEKGLASQIDKPQVSISAERGEAVQEEVVEDGQVPIESPKREETEEIEPEKQERLISPGDVVDIVVMERDDYSRIEMVRSDGKITYPPLGRIPAAGFTENRLSQEIAAGLSRYMNNPQTKVVVTGMVEFAKAETGEIEEYFIKSRDAIIITVEGRDNYSQTVVVQSNGRALYLPLGEIQAAGTTADQLSENISLKLSARIDNPKVAVNIGRFKEFPDEIHRAGFASPALLKRFGYDVFAGARNRILKLEESLTEATGALSAPSAVRDAISGFVGPVDMMGANVAATVPSKYVLGPGDQLTIRFWSDVISPPQTVPLVVDDEGEVVIPKAGKIVVRGMTLAQFEEAAREELTREAYKNLKLIATLDKLRSIQIFITGEAFRPGSYAVSAVTTLLNALYMCGGPSDIGSLRNIKLLRGNETKNVDLYEFLMYGDSSQNLPLDAGDTILIPQIGRTSAVSGEVKRPAVYELKEGEKLPELISLAGGVRPSGFLQRIQVDSVDPSKERIIIDVDLSKPRQAELSIFDGDTVTVFSIPSERMNVVTLEGKARMPGVYQLKEGMKVSDLIQAARGLLGEAYGERADLLRLNDDEKTATLIPVNLSKAIAGDGDNDISLKQWDRLIVHSKWDVKWTADRAVSVHGAVSRPGSYERSDGMTVADLLILSGGALPDAYLDRALLMRLGEKGEPTKSVPVNLKDSGETLTLKDSDTLLIYTYREAKWEPAREATVEGAVQNPGVFSRVDDMKISDLIHRAGGLLPEAYPERALLLRMNDRQQTAQGFFINTVLALQDDPKNNLILKDGDTLKIYTYEEAIWEPKREVTIAGAVLSPGVSERVDGMRVSDLLDRAGGLLPNAYLDRADISRFFPEREMYETVPVNLAGVLSKNEAADIPLQDGDLLTVYTTKEAQYEPKSVVTIHGMIQRPGTYARTIGMRLSDLLFVSGGLLPCAHKSIEVARIGDEGKASIMTLDVAALEKGEQFQDVLLEDEDMISVRKQKEFLDALRTTTVTGEVKYPGTYTLEYGDRLSDVILRVGGFTDRAYPEASVITRKIDRLILDEQRRSMHQVRKLLDDLSEQEYWRELARVELIQKRSETADEESETASQPLITTGTGIPVMNTLEEAVEVAAITGIPEQAGAAISSIEKIAQPQYTMVSPARKISSFLPSGRLIVNLRDAVENPERKSDIILEDGDVITIPSMPATISVSGAVIQPASLVYVKGKKVKHYIEMVGGYSKDADEESVYVIKANGMVVNSNKVKLAPGDMIVVPTRVMVQKVVDRWGQVIGVVKFAVTTLAMVYTIQLIVGQL